MHSLNIAQIMQYSPGQRLVQAVDEGLEVWVVQDAHFAASRSSAGAVVNVLIVQCQKAQQATSLGDQRLPLAKLTVLLPDH